MQHTKVQYHRTLGSGEVFEGLYHIWTWRTSWSHSWSCDQDYFYKFMPPLPNETSHRILLRLAKQFQKRRGLIIMVIYIFIAPG